MQFLRRRCTLQKGAQVADSTPALDPMAALLAGGGDEDFGAFTSSPASGEADRKASGLLSLDAEIPI